MKKILFLLIYVSLAFLIYKLVSNGFLVMPEIRSYEYLLLSVLFVCAGFVCQAASWQSVLDGFGLHVSLSEAIASVGITVFAKYIPGKIWMVTGRAAYLSHYSDVPLKKTTFISFYAQLFSIWTGLTLALLALSDRANLTLWSLPIVLPWTILSLLLFYNALHLAGELTLRFFRQRTVRIPRLGVRQVISISPWFLGTWLSWSVGFYMLVMSIASQPDNFAVAVAFPVAATLGILTYFAPGGLGVREGLMAAYLGGGYYSLQDATGIAVAARLWFLVGEVFLFLLGLLCHYWRKQELKSVHYDP